MIWVLACNDMYRYNERHSPKSESVLNTHPTNAYTKFEINWVITFPDKGRKRRKDGKTDDRWMDAHHSYVPSGHNKKSNLE